MNKFPDNCALLLVDLQNDFCPGGALAVAEGDRLMSIANNIMLRFSLVVASQDWHPDSHLCFASNHVNKKVGDIVDIDGTKQYLWPVHCVQNSFGAKLHANLNITKINFIVKKGTNKVVDSYSAFFDNKKFCSTGLDQILKHRNISEIYVMGIATDFCVKFTCLDAILCGFKVNLIANACRGVDLSPMDSEKSILEMKDKGVNIKYIPFQ